MSNRHARRTLARAQRALSRRRDPGTQAAQALAKAVTDAQENLNRFATMHKIATEACATASQIPVVEAPVDPETGDPNGYRTAMLAEAETKRADSRELVIASLFDLYDAYAAFDEPQPLIEVPTLVAPN